MKKEIRVLRTLQKRMVDNMYPGYPFQTSIIIDLNEQVAWVDYWGKKQPLQKALTQLYADLLYHIVDCRKITKRTWLQDQDLSTIEQIRNSDWDDFGIDNLNATKFYFMLVNAIYDRPKGDTNHYIFGWVDDDCDFVDMQVFDNLEQIQKHKAEYWTDE